MDIDPETGRLMLTLDEYAERCGAIYGAGFARCYTMLHERIHTKKTGLDKGCRFRVDVILTSLQLSRQRIVKEASKFLKEKLRED